MPTAALPLSRRQAVRDLAFQLGFDHAAFSPLTIPDRDRDAYASWVAAGHAAGMAYMTGDPSSRLRPAERFAGARSVLTLGVSYFQGPLPEKPGKAFGRVARYAWGEDYHPLILKRLDDLIARLPDVLGAGVAATPAIDTRPLLERALARQAGLGFVGKNTVLIIPRSSSMAFHVGSFVFLAELLLDAEVDAPGAPVADGCGSCTKCQSVCPTGALDTPRRLDANRCIAYLTIENKGPIPPEMRAALGDWLFGCDLCQDVCPFNARAFETRWPEFRADRGVGAWVDLRSLLDVDGPTFKRNFGATPFLRAKRRGMLRNACVVAGNSGDESLAPALETLTADAEPLARGHALWALHRLAPARAKSRAEALRADADEHVRADARVVLEGAHA
jgi:epoxyqueuosine reductase